MRQSELKFVQNAGVSDNGVPKSDHRLIRSDLVFKFTPGACVQYNKPRIDRTLLADPGVKLQFQAAVVAFIDR